MESMSHVQLTLLNIYINSVSFVISTTVVQLLMSRDSERHWDSKEKSTLMFRE